MSFNALKYVKELREVGVSQEQAEVQAKGLQLVQDDLLADLPTKQDLERGLNGLETKLDTKINKLDTKINNLESKLDTKINKLDTKINNLESKLDTKINKLDTKINNLETKLDTKINNLETNLNTKIDFVGKDLKANQGSQTLQIIGGMAALLAVFRFLPEFFKQ